MNINPSSANFFERKYAAIPDPWSFETDRYERKRYRAILNAMNNRLYSRAFEPGCSIGVLTAQLAPYCHSIDAIDASPTAVIRACERCQFLPNVHIRVGMLPGDLPLGKFDLIVFSEIGYYFRSADLAELIGTMTHKLTSSGVFLAAHWLGESKDHKLTGDDVHEVIDRQSGLMKVQSYRYEESKRACFRLDRWLRV